MSRQAASVGKGRPSSVAALAAWTALALVLATGPAPAQDATRGQHVFRKCVLCHVIDPNAKDLLAPPLHNVMGRRAATIRGFQYSDIMKLAGRKGLNWSADALFFFLDRPEDFMPGTYMAFPGLEEQERRDVIAYLEKLSRDFARSEAQRRQQQSQGQPQGQGQGQGQPPRQIQAPPGSLTR